MWDERYAVEDYIYGTQPNDFLREFFPLLTTGGEVLCLADGEGRNGVFLAEQGLHVTSVDASAVGLKKAQALAKSRGVSVSTLVVDLADYSLGQANWDGIVSVFCHLPPDLRRKVHREVVIGLKPGGIFLLEAYHPEQLKMGTGGPPNVEMMMSAELLKDELAGLEFVRVEELKRDVIEGSYHSGAAAVVQMVARKPY